MEKFNQAIAAASRSSPIQELSLAVQGPVFVMTVPSNVTGNAYGIIMHRVTSTVDGS